MSTVAEQLRAGREAKKLTIEKVAEATKIRTDHLRALEEGNFSVFSAPIYIRGSVKNYATLLKLDVPQIMAALDAELNRTEKFSEPPPLSEPPHNTMVDKLTRLLAKFNWKLGVFAVGILGIVLVAALIHFALKHHGKGDPLKNLQPALYQPANAGDTLPLPRR
jgi:cytoskeletal protein RodZ